MEEGYTERCPTGIAGFDKISRGGFVRNSNNVLIGGPGTGKTTFLLQFLWNGAQKFGENGIYCSFEPDIVETLKDAFSYGWDFAKLNETDKVKFLRFSPETSVDDLKGELTKIIAKYDIKRICFDPISILSLNRSDPGKIREEIFNLISLLKRLKVTTILADEAFELESEGDENSVWSSVDIIKFLTDSVINLYDSWNFGQGAGERAIKIVKMRRTAHIREHVEMRITNKGMDIFYDKLI